MDRDIRVLKKFKVVLLGDTRVGKSSIVGRFVRNEFHEDYPPSIGAEFSNHEMKSKSGKDVELHIWDTAGSAIYRPLARMYIKDSKICFYVFDVNNSQSYEEAKKWVIESQTHLPKESVMCMIGNKIDLSPELREVGQKEALKFAEENSMKYYEVSARTGDNITNFFPNAVEDALEVEKLFSSMEEEEEDVIDEGREEDNVIFKKDLKGEGDEVDQNEEENNPNSSVPEKEDPRYSRYEVMDVDDPNRKGPSKKKKIFGKLFSSVSAQRLGNELQIIDVEISSDEDF